MNFTKVSYEVGSLEHKPGKTLGNVPILYFV
jgi:hypothetical protein